MNPLRHVVALAALWLLIAGANRADAVSYIGFGAAGAASANSEVTAFGSADTVTRSAGPGFGLEAQFGWESAPWIDIEGALRYHRFGLSGTVSNTLLTAWPTGYSLVGFEGGVRLHPRRGLTNSVPYVRLGLGSFSPSIELSDGGAISNATTLGYFVGIGYTREISSSYGVDVRATGIFVNAFDPAVDGIDLKARFITVAVSIIVF